MAQKMAEDSKLSKLHQHAEAYVLQANKEQ